MHRSTAATTVRRAVLVLCGLAGLAVATRYAFPLVDADCPTRDQGGGMCELQRVYGRCAVILAGGLVGGLMVGRALAGIGGALTRPVVPARPRVEPVRRPVDELIRTATWGPVGVVATRPVHPVTHPVPARPPAPRMMSVAEAIAVDRARRAGRA